MDKEYQDKEIICTDCLRPFIWDAGAQRFFASQRFTPPKRCPQCRAYRRRKIYQEQQQNERREEARHD